MRHRNVWAGGLAVGLGLCVVGIALGQDPADSEGNWFTRLFAHGRPAAFAKKQQQEEKKEVRVVPAVPPGIARKQAQTDYLRRLEVCDKLREIGFQNDDGELMRKADQLEQRAKDAFVQRTNRIGGGDGFDEQALERHLTKAGGPSLLSGDARKTGDGQASAEVRK